MEIIKTFLIGICVGMANVIPGVSGGTMAVVFNIYDKFVNAITLNFKKIWQNRKFVFPLLTGMALGVLLFSKLITILYTHFPLQTNWCFVGLIVGSIPIMFKLMILGGTQEDSESPKTKLSGGKIISMVACAIAGFALVSLFAYLQTKFDKNAVEQAVMPDVSVKLLVRIFSAGILGAVAMIIPGISGSLLMLVMGVYTIVISCIPALFNPSTFMHALILLLPNGVGVIIGLLCGAKLISWLFKIAPNQTYAVIFGLLCCSAFVLMKFNFTGVLSIVGAIAAFCAGVLIAFFGSRLDSSASKSNSSGNDKA